MYRFIIIILVFLSMASCGFFGDSYTITHTSMKNGAQLRWEEDSTVLVMAGNSDVQTTPLKLSKGKYSIRFRAKGTFSSGMAPHFEISLGGYTIKDIFVNAGLNSYQFNFELPENIEAPLHFIFNNDHRDSTGDRNIFLHYPVLIDPY